MNETGFSVRHVATQTHGRVLIQDAADSLSPDTLVVFHGYAQAVEVALMDVSTIPGVAERWRVVAIQGLHRFYAKDERVVASWMTRQDRDEAIADNVAYVDRVVAEEIARLAQDDCRPARNDRRPARNDRRPARNDRRPARNDRRPARNDRRPARASGRQRVVFLGFSQGASMAYRAAVLGRHTAAGVIALAGDIPPEVKQPAAARQPWPRVLIGVGNQEHWYTPDKVSADAAFLVSQGVKPDICRFNGGHEWTAEFRAVVGQWLDGLA